MAASSKILREVKHDGFYEEKVHDPLGVWADAHMHNAYAMTSSGIIVRYDAFLRTKHSTTPSVFRYNFINPRNGELNGKSGVYFAQNDVLPISIEENMSTAVLEFYQNEHGGFHRAHDELEKEIKLLPVGLKENFGNIEQARYGYQEEYNNGKKTDNAIQYGKDLDFMMICKIALVHRQQEYAATHPEYNKYTTKKESETVKLNWPW